MAGSGRYGDQGPKMCYVSVRMGQVGVLQPDE
jgi:hypothetical protein